MAADYFAGARFRHAASRFAAMPLLRTYDILRRHCAMTPAHDAAAMRHMLCHDAL